MRSSTSNCAASIRAHCLPCPFVCLSRSIFSQRLPSSKTPPTCPSLLSPQAHPKSTISCFLCAGAGDGNGQGPFSPSSASTSSWHGHTHRTLSFRPLRRCRHMQHATPTSTTNNTAPATARAVRVSASCPGDAARSRAPMVAAPGASLREGVPPFRIAPEVVVGVAADVDYLDRFASDRVPGVVSLDPHGPEFATGGARRIRGIRDPGIRGRAAAHGAGGGRRDFDATLVAVELG